MTPDAQSIILHHYPMSPYSEKIRLALGLKEIAWQSVIISPVTPRPDLIPMTGGYRRTPVMQVGADIYCDTQLILRTLERLHPQPSLFPGRTQGEVTALTWWWDRSTFLPAVGVVAALNADRFTPDFIEERRQFLGFSLTEMPAKLPFYLQQLAAHFDWLLWMLDRGGKFLLGDAPSAADLTAYHTIWFLRQNGGGKAETLLPIGKLAGWYERVTAIGHGKPRELPSTAALVIARAAEPAPPHIAADGDPSGLKPGQRITVTPDDMGRDPVEGVLVAADSQEIIIRRNDEKTGAMQVHFPRAGFEAKPA
jgi:glutathione S-transferase